MNIMQVSNVCVYVNLLSYSHFSNTAFSKVNFGNLLHHAHLSNIVWTCDRHRYCPRPQGIRIPKKKPRKGLRLF